MRMREGRGQSLIALPTDYTVVDLETTGLSPEFDEIIEVAALRVRDSRIVESFQQLIKPSREISAFITSLTGISNEMVVDAPPVAEVLPRLLDFIGGDVVLGHNVAFDINFIFDNACDLGLSFTNDYVNTVRIAKKAIPTLGHHRLIDLCQYFNLNLEEISFHRALADCQATHEIYQRMRESFADEGEFLALFRTKCRKWNTIDARLITCTVPEDEIDKENPLFGKRVVFTGQLERFARRDAMQIVANLGGVNDNGVTKKTDYLVLGCNDYCPTIRDGKSSKQKKAEQYALAGTGISILDEKTFYDLIQSE